jgi:hypothetical protein
VTERRENLLEAVDRDTGLEDLLALILSLGLKKDMLLDSR